MQFNAILLFDLANSASMQLQLQDQAFKINHTLLREQPSSTWQWQLLMVLAPPLRYHWRHCV